MNKTSIFDGSSTFVELSLQSVPAFVNYASNAVTSASNYGKLNVWTSLVILVINSTISNTSSTHYNGLNLS